jgi:ABC-type uncharacterized transport system fused permease/ATPase subunit
MHYDFDGRIMTPPLEDIFVLPQSPYIPYGNIRDIVNYPESEYNDSGILDILGSFGLSHLVQYISKDIILLFNFKLLFHNN